MNKSLIIVGAGWAGKTIASVIARDDPSKIIGFVDDRFGEGSSEKPGDSIVISNGNGGVPVKVLGRSSDLIRLVREHGAQGVVIAITHDRADHLLSQVVKCYEEDIAVYEMPELFAKLTRKVPVQHINRRWVIPNLAAPPNNLYTFFHDATNYVLGLLGLLFAFVPFFPIAALLIKLDSKGPVFYRQKRVGKKGSVFELLKFRTMRQNADRQGTAWTTKDDDRITRVGRWMRKYRLDELPQLVNVLKGEMALIGPRPEAVDLVELFRQQIPFYEYRYLVRPGITGWAQVNYENTCSVEGALEKLQYDLYWIKNRSFWLDLKIIFKSAKVMLTGFGAI